MLNMPGSDSKQPNDKQMDPAEKKATNINYTTLCRNTL